MPEDRKNQISVASPSPRICQSFGRCWWLSFARVDVYGRPKFHGPLSPAYRGRLHRCKSSGLAIIKRSVGPTRSGGSPTDFRVRHRGSVRAIENVSGDVDRCAQPEITCALMTRPPGAIRQRSVPPERDLASRFEPRQGGWRIAVSYNEQCSRYSPKCAGGQWL